MKNREAAAFRELADGDPLPENRDDTKSTRRILAYLRLVDTHLHGHVESRDCSLLVCVVVAATAAATAITVRADQSFVALADGVVEQAHRVLSRRVVVRVPVHSLDRSLRVPRALERENENHPPTRYGARLATESDFLSQPVFKTRSSHRNTRSLTHVTSPARAKRPNVIASSDVVYVLRALRFNCASLA